MGSVNSSANLIFFRCGFVKQMPVTMKWASYQFSDPITPAIEVLLIDPRVNITGVAINRIESHSK